MVNITGMRFNDNNWEDNAGPVVTIEGGSAFTFVGDSFARNDNAQLEFGVAGDRNTQMIHLFGLAFHDSPDTSHLTHFGEQARGMNVGPFINTAGHALDAFRIEPGAEVICHHSVPGRWR